MMLSLGHEVYLYSGDQNTFPCTKHFPCFTEDQRAQHVGAGKHYTATPWHESLMGWKTLHANAIHYMNSGEVLREKDIICLQGNCHARPMMAAFPNHLVVEFGIGYEGTAAKYRVWESYAWMHACYAVEAGSPNRADGKFFDAVIPNYLDISKYPTVVPSESKGDYYLYVGRMIERKGVQVAADTCKALGAKLICAGHGDFIPEGSHIEYLGEITHDVRNELMSKCKAFFCPTLYVEPFGSVAIEAAACGAPVICTDWGAFTENVQHGVTGFRCRTLKEFVSAAQRSSQIHPDVCRGHALKYNYPVVAQQYQKYFERLLTLFGDGWYTL